MSLTRIGHLENYNPHLIKISKVVCFFKNFYLSLLINLASVGTGQLFSPQGILCQCFEMMFTIKQYRSELAWNSNISDLVKGYRFGLLGRFSFFDILSISFKFVNKNFRTIPLVTSWLRESLCKHCHLVV